MGTLSKLVLTVIIVLSLSILATPKQGLSASAVEYGVLEGTGVTGHTKDDKKPFKTVKARLVFDRVDPVTELLVEGRVDVAVVDEDFIVLEELQKDEKCVCHVHPVTEEVSCILANGTKIKFKRVEETTSYLAEYIDADKGVTGLVLLEDTSK